MIAQLVEANGGGVVGRDGHDGDALVVIVGVQPGDPALVGLGGRAMVAGEDDDQDLGLGEVRQGVSLAIDARQLEVGGGRTDRQGIKAGRVGGRRDSQDENGEDGDQQRERDSFHFSFPPVSGRTDTSLKKTVEFLS